MSGDSTPAESIPAASTHAAGSSTEPGPGDILLFANATGMNRLITFFSRSRYYHAALYAGDAHVLEARPQGVTDRDLRGPLGTHYCAVIPAPDGRGEAALAWARAQLGAKYDRMDTLVVILEHIFLRLHLNYAPPGKFSCAEFVALAYQNAGVDLFHGRDLHGLDPADFESLLPPGEKPHNLV
ncbi:MAG: hypothetical protein LC772_05335 [Chloroflexi bacterium]|nr:hypothetical protein [Chloroflexota bacterium]